MSLIFRGDDVLRRRFQSLPERLQRKYLRRGVTKAARRTSREAKRRVPVDSGTLKLSIGIRVRTKKGRVTGAVGPRRNMRSLAEVGAKRQLRDEKGRFTKKQKRLVPRNPTRYAHLIEFGTKHSEPQPFMRPAEEATVLPNLALIAAEVRAGVIHEGTKG